MLGHLLRFTLPILTSAFMQHTATLAKDQFIELRNVACTVTVGVIYQVAVFRQALAAGLWFCDWYIRLLSHSPHHTSGSDTERLTAPNLNTDLGLRNQLSRYLWEALVCWILIEGHLYICWGFLDCMPECHITGYSCKDTIGKLYRDYCQNRYRPEAGALERTVIGSPRHAAHHHLLPTAAAGRAARERGPTSTENP